MAHPQMIGPYLEILSEEVPRIRKGSLLIEMNYIAMMANLETQIHMDDVDTSMRHKSLLKRVLTATSLSAGVSIALVIAAAGAFMPAASQTQKDSMNATVEGDSTHCPDVDSLGEEQKSIFRMRLELVLDYLNHLSGKQEIGVTAPPSIEVVRVLESHKDSAVCQKLNERFSVMLNARQYIGYEYDALYPKFQPIYFEFNDLYFALLVSYAPEPPPGKGILMSTGPSILAIHDDNLNQLHLITH